MRYLLIILLVFMMGKSQGQTAAEWTRQKKTQIEYLLQQIVANKVHIEYIQKGYGIARKGLNTIQNIKKGEFNLHRDFFNSLRDVNPRVSTYSKIADIIAYQVRVVKRIGSTIKALKESGQFNPGELAYTKAVFDNLLEECLKSIDELYLVITSGQLEMKDDQRIKRIDQLYLDMQDKYSFCQSFSEECSILAIQRLSEGTEINLSKKLNGLE